MEGNVLAVYNMGTNDHPIGEVGVKVNDNQYHVVRFSRTGPNSTLQVDDYNLQSNHPAGKLFKSLRRVELLPFCKTIKFDKLKVLVVSTFILYLYMRDKMLIYAKSYRATGKTGSLIIYVNKPQQQHVAKVLRKLFYFM